MSTKNEDTKDVTYEVQPFTLHVLSKPRHIKAYVEEGFNPVPIDICAIMKVGSFYLGVSWAKAENMLHFHELSTMQQWRCIACYAKDWAKLYPKTTHNEFKKYLTVGLSKTFVSWLNKAPMLCIGSESIMSDFYLFVYSRKGLHPECPNSIKQRMELFLAARCV